jgi:Zn-dependent M16 (insulinase) family peptidase
MNAWTYPDFTMYPFASQNAQDFSNLMAVYLDCVFFPKLTEMDFKQEGWHLEPEDLTNPDSQIILKGVVYNEMKGVFSNSENLFEIQLQQSILPSHTYSTSYGGDPLSIPDLTWSQLKAFHAHHYHPSNARFYTYGNQPLKNHLEAIGQLALGRFSKIDRESVIPNEVKWTEPVSGHVRVGPTECI